MTRWQGPLSRFPSPWRRALLAAAIGDCAAAFLYLRMHQGSAGILVGQAGVDTDRLTAEVPVEHRADRPGSAGAAQASVSDQPDGLRSAGGKTMLTGRLALLVNLGLLERGRALLQRTPGYTATFFKQERVGKELAEGTAMRLKLRHEPLSIYLRWLSGDTGRELIYIEGRNDGKMIVHAGGWKGRLLPTVKLDPEGTRAMRESRHPVTQIGLLEVVRRSIAHRNRDLEAARGVRCRMIDGCRFDGRECWCFVIEYQRGAVASDYRKSVVHVDKQYSLPVSVKNYGWPKAGAPLDAAILDEQTLLEAYSYTEIDLNPGLTEADFDRDNEEYAFR